MNWKDEIKKEETVGKDLDSLVGLEGGLGELMKKISERLPEADNVEIAYHSSSRPVIAFNLPIFVRCSFGSKDFPSNTEVFTIKDVMIGKK